MEIEYLLEEEVENWLKQLAQQCLAHMHFVEGAEADGEALTVEDYGMLELERGFLTLYAMHTGGVEADDDTDTTH